MTEQTLRPQSAAAAGNVRVGVRKEDAEEHEPPPPPPPPLPPVQREFELVTKRLQVEKQRLRLLEQNILRTQEHLKAKDAEFFFLPPRDAASSGCGTTEVSPIGKGPKSGTPCPEGDVQKASSQVKSLENKLKNVLIKRDCIVDENLKRRVVIDEERRECLRLTDTLRLQEKELSVADSQLSELRETSRSLKQSDAELRIQLTSLNRRGKEQRKNFNQARERDQMNKSEQKRRLRQLEMKQKKDVCQQKAVLLKTATSGSSPSHLGPSSSSVARLSPPPPATDPLSLSPPSSSSSSSSSSCCAPVVREAREKRNSLMKQVLKEALVSCVHQKQLIESRRRSAFFTTAVERIKTATGIQDVDAMVRQVQSLEDKSYSVLTYVNALTLQIETLEASNQALLRRLHADSQRAHDAEKVRQAALNPMEKQISILHRISEKGRDGLRLYEDVLEECRQSLVDSVMTKVSFAEPSRANRGGANRSQELLPGASSIDLLPGDVSNTSSLLPLLQHLHRFFLKASIDFCRPPREQPTAPRLSTCVYDAEPSAMQPSSPKGDLMSVPLLPVEEHSTQPLFFTSPCETSGNLLRPRECRRSCIAPEELPQSSNLLRTEEAEDSNLYSDSDSEELSQRPLSVPELKKKAALTIMSRKSRLVCSQLQQEHDQTGTSDLLLPPIAPDSHSNLSSDSQQGSSSSSYNNNVAFSQHFSLVPETGNSGISIIVTHEVSSLM